MRTRIRCQRFGGRRNVNLEFVGQDSPRYLDYHNGLYQALTVVGTQLKDLEDKFAPIPPPEDRKWINILIDIATMGTLSVAGPFFNGFLKETAYFINKAAANYPAFDNTKNTVMTFIGQGSTLTKDLLSRGKPNGDSWTPQSQDSFSGYIGTVVDIWGNVTDAQLRKMFSGLDDSPTTLGNIIADGKLIDGREVGDSPPKTTISDLQTNMEKTIFGFSIPALW